MQGLSQAFPQSARFLETHGSWQGPINYIIADGVKSSKSIVRVNAYGGEIFLHFPGGPPSMKSGDVLSVRGVRAGDRATVESVKVEATQVAAEGAGACLTTGAQKIAVILANLKNFTLPPNGGRKRGFRYDALDRWRSSAHS